MVIILTSLVVVNCFVSIYLYYYFSDLLSAARRDVNKLTADKLYWKALAIESMRELRKVNNLPFP